MAMKWNESRFNTPLARAQGLGSSHHGMGHWMHQRLTAIANLFLVGWFVISITCHVNAHADYAVFTDWIANGLNPVLMILLVVFTAYHTVLGLQVVIEDYIPAEGTRVISLIALKLVLFAVTAVCLFSILKVAV
jgi:succinate dehydrogenase / fumarate reductase membrane anchor subunit